jgi:cytoskeletal protein CcmA (bactofilin family)
MNKEELLRRLEERLARGEIGEKTYLGIKARYDAMPDVASPPEAPLPPDPPTPPRAPGDLETIIERTVEQAMEQVAAAMETAFASRKDADRHVREVNERLEKAMSKFGPQVVDGGRKIVIRGAGVMPGDTVTEEFKCAGSCRVEGSLKAREVHVSGSCLIEGGCECQEFHASGKAEVRGDVQAAEFHVAGKSEVHGDLRAGDVSVSGKAEIHGSILDAEDVSLAGGIRVGRDVRTGDFNSRGQFEIGGTLEAEDISIRLAGTSRVPTMKGAEISVRRGERNGELVVGTIEGGEVYVESTRARTIKGESVHVGPFCTVDEVQAGELVVHESSTVKKRTTLEAGYHAPHFEHAGHAGHPDHDEDDGGADEAEH